MKRRREEPCAVCGHYHDYDGGEQCSTCGCLKNETYGACDGLAQSSSIPSEIVPGFLYMGTYDTASRSDLLQTFGITHVLNMIPNVPVLFKNSFTYHTVSTQKPIPFDECFAFLESVRSAGQKVLVYCMSGLSISPTVVLAYLACYHHTSLMASFSRLQQMGFKTKIKQAGFEELAKIEQKALGVVTMGWEEFSAKQKRAPT